MLIPNKLERGDEVRIVAPSCSLNILSKENQKKAEDCLKTMGLEVTYAKNVFKCDALNSSSIEDRVDDLHQAFADKNVKGILPAIGGFNCNQLLPYLDYKLIRDNPKILMGFSDATALHNAIYAKSGLITYSGAFFTSFAMQEGLSYTLEYFKKMLFNTSAFDVLPSSEWSDDLWYKDQEKREFLQNDGYWILNEGNAKGTLLGGNLCTFQLLHGTEFLPTLENTILFLEDDAYTDGCDDVEFERNIVSLIHQPNFSKVKGIVVGRFQKKSNITFEKLSLLLKSKKELASIPIITNADFGHTTPSFTFPIGGKVEISAHNDTAVIKILEG